MAKAKTKKKKAEMKDDTMLSKKEWLAKFFGKFKEFGNGVEYQRKLRDA